jgi:hypothetical protein
MLNTLHSSILLEKTNALIKDTIITDCQGNGINTTRGTKAMISHCTIRRTDFPPLAFCDGSFAYAKKCSLSDSKMSGIVVRNGSKAAIKKCTIQNVKQTGIVVSDSEDVTITSSFVFNCEEAALGVYNHSNVHLGSSFLMGPSRVGIDVFTGGFVHALETTIAGMRETCIWLHHGGSGRFVSTLMHTLVPDSPDAIIDAIKSVRISEIQAEVPDEKLFRIDSNRSFVSSGSFAVGRGLVDLILNETSERAKPGTEAVGGTCRKCSNPANDCFFAPCGHAIYCAHCWNELEAKPSHCPLCAIVVNRVATPIDCSHGDDTGTCGICLSQQVDSIVVPCGHLICSDCGRAWFAEHADCPYCREVGAKCRRFVSYA